MKFFTARAFFKVTAIVAAVAVFASLSVAHEILAILLAGLACFVVCAAKVTYVICRHTWRWCTDAEYRTLIRERKERLAVKVKVKAKAYRARSKFLDNHDDDDERRSSDLDPLVIGSIAWIGAHEYGEHFMDHTCSTSSNMFESGINSFDTHFDKGIVSVTDMQSPWSDWVTGGTDASGAHGMSGHHDQFPSTDFGSTFDHSSSSIDHSSSIGHSSSFSSHDSFGSGM